VITFSSTCRARRARRFRWRLAFIGGKYLTRDFYTMHMLSLPRDAQNTPMSSQTRTIVEEWKRVSEHYRASVLFLEEHGVPLVEAPRWGSPRGADVFLSLEISKANRLLEAGPRTYSHVCSVADKLAFTIVGRAYGIETAARALRHGRACTFATSPLTTATSEA